MDAVISAGRAGDAWSGGDVWKDPELVTEITRFVYEGGCLIGAGEPSAVPGGDTRFALAHVLGVDQDDGSYACHQPWTFDTEEAPFFVEDKALGLTPGIRLTGPKTKVLREKDGVPVLTLHGFGKGKAAYFGGFSYSPEAARMLLELLLHLTGADGRTAGIADDPLAECAWFPASHTLVVMNGRDVPADVSVSLPQRKLCVHLEANQTLFCGDS